VANSGVFSQFLTRGLNFLRKKVESGAKYATLPLEEGAATPRPHPRPGAADAKTADHYS